MKLLVTGGAGFIGSAFVRFAVKKGCKVVVVDKLTYAADLKRLGQAQSKIKFYKADICDSKRIDAIFKAEKPSLVVHFAAETHVDRSIVEPTVFLDTNIRGTQTLLDASRKYKVKRFVHLSTDEIYGDIEKGSFSEESPYHPNSPYAASKAAADLLINSYIRTYGFPAIIVRPSNNYGPWQYPEKLIPLVILKILRNEKIPVYGDGKNVREWLYVEDSAQGIFEILRKGKIGEAYNLGSSHEKHNIDVVRTILRTMAASEDLISFVKDRLGHDIRYRLNSAKLFKNVGFKPRVGFEEGIELTVRWCLENKKWLLSKWGENIAKLYK